jgi:hypothetical protein
MIVPAVLPVASTLTVSSSQQPPLKKARSNKKKSMDVNVPTLATDSLDDTLSQVWSDPDTISTATSVEDEDDFHSNSSEFETIQLRPTKRPLVPRNPNAPKPSKRGKKALSAATATTVSVSLKQSTPKSSPLMIAKPEVPSPGFSSVQAASIPCFQYGAPQESPRSVHVGIQQSSPSYFATSQGNGCNQGPSSPKSYHEVIFIVWKALSRFMHRFRYSIRDFSMVTENEEMMNVLIHKFSQALVMYNQEFPISGDAHQDALRENQLQLFLDQVLISVIRKFVDSLLFSALDQSGPSSPAFQQQVCSSSAPNSPILMPRSTVAPCSNHVPFSNSENGHSPYHHQEQYPAQPIQQQMYQMHSQPPSPYLCPQASEGLVAATYSAQNTSSMGQSFSLMNYHEVAQQQAHSDAIVLEQQQVTVVTQDFKELSDFMEYFAVEENWIVQEC